jgi:hypothetical protein
MKRAVIAAVLLAAVCVAGSTSGYAQRGGFVRGAARPPDPTTLGNPAPPTPTFQTRSPAPLASPSQADANVTRRGANVTPCHLESYYVTNLQPRIEKLAAFGDGVMT